MEIGNHSWFSLVGIYIIMGLLNYSESKLEWLANVNGHNCIEIYRKFMSHCMTSPHKQINLGANLEDLNGFGAHQTKLK